MQTCKNCGAEIAEGQKFCGHCGSEIKTEGSEQNTNGKTKTDETIEKIKKLNDTADTTASFTKDDIEANKGLAVLAYFSWLVLIPLFAAKNSPFARYHSNQGLILAIVETVFSILSGAITAIFTAIFFPVGQIISALFSIVSIALFVVAIIGIVNAANGKAKELPVIGKYRL